MNRTMIVLAALASAVSGSGSTAWAAPADEEAELSAAWDGFAAELGKMKTYIRNHPYYQEPENQAAAYAYLSTLVLARIEEDIVFDADFPNFRVIDPRPAKVATILTSAICLRPSVGERHIACGANSAKSAGSISRFMLAIRLFPKAGGQHRS